VTDGPISFGDLDEQFAEQAARTVKGSTSHEDGPRSPETAPDVTSLDCWACEAHEPVTDEQAEKLFQDYLGAELDGARNVIEGNWRIQTLSPEELISMYPQATTKRYLKATANGADWDSARRAVAKIESYLDNEDMLDKTSPLVDAQTEHMVRIVARVIARARTRGRKETLEAMDLDTDDCFDEVEE